MMGRGIPPHGSIGVPLPGEDASMGMAWEDSSPAMTLASTSFSSDPCIDGKLDLE
jgi:hypothetical protein